MRLHIFDGRVNASPVLQHVPALYCQQFRTPLLLQMLGYLHQHAIRTTRSYSGLGPGCVYELQ